LLFKKNKILNIVCFFLFIFLLEHRLARHSA
jgi:hypothetical protein